MINELQAYRYCREDASKIENYDKAIADTERVWDIHHRLEIQGPFTNSAELLKRCGMYYNVPASQLIFLTHAEHIQLHTKGRTSQWKGKHLSEEHRQKISESSKGKHKYWLGKRRSDETRRKISEAAKGKHLSDEHRRKLSEAQKRRRQREAGLCI